jgi:hypothetical protein
MTCMGHSGVALMLTCNLPLTTNHLPKAGSHHQPKTNVACLLLFHLKTP